MKKYFLSSRLIYLLVLAFTSLSYGQSDYETVQKFKKDCEKIEYQIKNANSLDEINLITENIQQLRSIYSKHSELIDKAMYPEKYETSIQKLNSLYAIRESEFSRMDVLKVEVTELKQKVDTLDEKNNELQASLMEIQLLFEKSKKETSKLNTIIADLKIALNKRDVLVMNTVRSIMPPVMREKPMLSSEDKEQIESEVDKNNILVNVKTTIRDNIRYLDLTSLQPEDIAEIQEQQLEFADTWAQIGPKLAEVYSDDKNRSTKLLEIDSLFTLWTASVEKEAWQSIKEEFNANGIALNDFSDGEEFANSMIQYIESEKTAIEALPEEEAKQSFERFADRAWKAEIGPKWTPFLIEKKMLAENSKDAIEENIDIWRSELYSSNWWIWILIPGILLAGLAILLGMLKKGAQFYDVPQE